jgi:biotin carboxylase
VSSKCDPRLVSTPRLLLIASKLGYQTDVFRQAAERAGIDLLLATDRCHQLDDPWGDRAIPLRFEDPDAASEALTAELPSSIKGLLAVGDQATLIAARTAQRAGLPFHSVDAVEVCRDKSRFRSALRAAGLPCPAHAVFPLERCPATSPVGYPCVLKPLGLSASRGVIRADSDKQFAEAFTRIRALLELPEIRQQRSERDRFIQVETFIEGAEFTLEGLVHRGQLHTFTLFEKPDPLDGPFFEETIYVQPPRIPDRVEAAIVSAVAKMVTTIGLYHGPIHAEMRVPRLALEKESEVPVWLLEIAARPIGGLCAQALRFDGGASLEDLLVRHAVGEDVRGARLLSGASGVMMIPVPGDGIFQGTDGVEEAAAVPHMEAVRVTAVEGYRLRRLPEGNSYPGFLFARASTTDEVDRALRKAHAKLHFHLATELEVV